MAQINYLNETGLQHFYNGLKAKEASYSDIDEIFGIRPVTIKPFATATDAEITAMLEAVRNGAISADDLGWQVGDERIIHLSAMEATGVGESHVEQDQTLVILHGADMFDLVDGGKNLFVIGLKDMLANGTAKEGGGMKEIYSNEGGWEGSTRKDWCNNVFRAAFPDEVQKWFRAFKFKTSNGRGSTAITESVGYFTFPSEIEVFGVIKYSIAGEGSQMDYYKDVNNRKKTHGGSINPSTTNWWERSPVVNSNSDYTNSYCSVLSTNGSAIYNGADNPDGLSPFGCV